MRIGRAHEVEVAHAVPFDVVDECALSLDEAPVLLARDALALRGALLELGDLAGLDGRHALTLPAATTASTMFQ